MGLCDGGMGAAAAAAAAAAAGGTEGVFEVWATLCRWAEIRS